MTRMTSQRHTVLAAYLCLWMIFFQCTVYQCHYRGPLRQMPQSSWSTPSPNMATKTATLFNNRACLTHHRIIIETIELL